MTLAMTFAQTIGRLAKEDPAPLYLQLQRALRDAINNRLLHQDDAIPPERDLAEDFDISRSTVRKAIEGLVAEGLLTRRRGAGTFVASRVEKSFSKLSSFSEDMISRGRKPHSEWVSKTSGAVTPEESLSLGLSPGALVYRFQRIRYADGQTMAMLRELDHSRRYRLASLENRRRPRSTRRWKRPATVPCAPCNGFAPSTLPPTRPNVWASSPATPAFSSNAAASFRMAVPPNSPNPTIAGDDAYDVVAELNDIS